jgi:cytochrome c
VAPGDAGAPGPGLPGEPLQPAAPQLLVQVFPVGPLTDGSSVRCLAPNLVVNAPDGVDVEPIAVAATGATWFVQSREPARLLLVGSGGGTQVVELGGESVADTGHHLFHHDAGSGIACASCHGEGGEDGHVWHFSGFGPRRTQALHVGLADTAPFHWSGDMAGMGALMEEVLVARMGGVHQSPERGAALEAWLFALRPPPPLRAATDPAAVRGRALFEGAAECSQCHAGAKLTNNTTVDVGTGEALQVPSLLGVGGRGPWLHTGCASSLRDRFDPGCGGSAHGKTAELDAGQIDDLVAYLEAL